MKTKNLGKYLMVAATIGILFTACRKKDVEDSDTSASADNAMAEVTYNDVHNIADQAATGSLSSYSPALTSNQKDMLSVCATITNNTTVTPHVLTIDFGTSNCVCSDGRTRRGKINVSYSGNYSDSLSTHTISFDNYFVNDNQIEGTKTVTNNGRNAAGNYVFAISVNGIIVKANNGGTITWTSERTREWFQNGTPNDWSDDHYLITGSASGTTAAGNTFTAQIITPLRRNVGCHHFVSGEFTFSPSNKPMRTVDFGNGACDDLATVTINGRTYNITLR